MIGQGSAAPLAGAFAASLALTALAVGWARRLGAIDAPDARRLNAEATPRGGGIGIALVTIAGLLLWPLADGASAWALPAALAVAAGTGGWDDLRPLPPLVKLAGQGVAALLVAWTLPFPAPVLGEAAAMAVSALGVLVAINVWNFMDGSNGMAATQAALVALALAVLADPPLATVALVLLGGCLGFLPFNLPRARVFLGDIGSHTLGVALAMILLAGLRDGAAGPGSILLLVSAFLLDAGWTLLLRLGRGEAVWRPHRKHLYQLAIASGCGHLPVCLGYAAWTGLLALGVLALENSGSGTPPVAVAGVAVLGSLVYFSLRRRWRGALDRAGSQS